MRYAGRYELSNNVLGAFDMRDGRLVSVFDGLPDKVFLPVGVRQFYSTSRNCALDFVVDAHGEVTAVVVTTKGQSKKAPRVGPLMHTLKARIDPDPDPARTASLQALLADILAHRR